MRLLRLGLHAFGPFTETVLELSGPSSGGLHIVYGRNEAGKSTALRAVSGLLFGMGERTPDAHLHQGRELKLSALVEDGSRRLAFIRRKRRKDSLRTPDDEPLAEAELAAFLHGVDATLFHTLFGLDHERLKQGGQALLSGQGDIGESLFDAGTGGAGIHAVLGDLERECELLFKARASKPTLNAAVQEYRQAKKQTRDEVRLPEKYLEQLRQLEQAREQRQALTQQRAELSRRRERLDRVLATLPIVARREQCLLELEALASVPELPEGTTLRRQEAQQVLSECARDIERIERELARREAELAGLPTDVALVELSKHVIDEIRDKVGIHKKAARDLPNVRGQIKQAEAEAQRILSKIGHAVDLEQAQHLRLSTARIATIRRLARERGVLFQKRETLGERLRQLQEDLEQQRRELCACGPRIDLGPLEQALGEAKAAGDLEGRVAGQRELLAEAARRSVDLERRLFKAPLNEGAAKGVVEQETIEAFASRLAQAERVLEQAITDQSFAERELAEAERHIDAIQRQGVVPTEAELVAARGERDAGFRSLLEDRARAELSPERIDAYVTLIARSDDLADRLRREAQRVAELSQWQAALEHWRARLESTSRAHTEAEGALAQLMDEWRRLWGDLPHRLGSPGEMLAWRRRYEEWQSSQTERARLERQLEELAVACAGRARALAAALGEAKPAVDLSLAGLVAAASEQLAALRQRERERQTLELAVKQLEASVAREQRALEASEQPLSVWEQAWAAAVEPLGLGTAPGADEALAVLEEMVELMRKLDELPQNRRRVTGMERDAKAFEALLNPLLAKYATDLIGLSVEEAAERFVSRYQEATRHAEERDRLQGEINALEHELSQEQAKRTQAEQQLSELLLRAHANDSAELEHLESQWRQVQELRERLRELDDQLLDQGGGTQLKVLIEEASATDRPALVVQRDALKAELEDTETAWRDAEVTIDRLERGLHYYSDEAASDSRQQLEQRAAHVRELLERYLRVRLAKTLLEREIARYRERHQGPVLSRASQLFRRLTLERFQGLRVGLEERTLSSVRADGDELLVNELSEGTQYQLYLALRLATLEHYMKDSAPIPLVLDDLLIHFDDERAAAAFSVLGELSERIQILYFTHLSRDLALSERSVSPTVLRHHYLTPLKERVSVAYGG